MLGTTTTTADVTTGAMITTTTPTDYSATNSFVTRAADTTDANGNTIKGAVTNFSEFFFDNFQFIDSPSMIQRVWLWN